MVQMDQSICAPLVLKFDPYVGDPPRQRIYINEATCSVMYRMFSHDSINVNELLVAWNYPQT